MNLNSFFLPCHKKFHLPFINIKEFDYNLLLVQMNAKNPTQSFISTKNELREKTYQEKKQHGGNSVKSALKACIVLLPCKKGRLLPNTLLK